MLHEVLLALSGHPSPLFGDSDEQFPLLSPSERSLLRSIGRLSGTHRRLKRHLESISSSHQSIICRAVATSIQQTHLARFQQRILDVEGRILTRDSSVVGAYEIVPLATVVGEFDDWHRRMAWYWEIACFMSPPKGPARTTPTKLNIPSTSAKLIDRLRAEIQTGFPDIEEAATELARIAELAWLRQLSSWVIYGKLPSFGAQDFFVQVDGKEEQTFKVKKDLLPDFVISSTASSIFFIGKSLHQVQHHLRQAKSVSFTASDTRSNEADLPSMQLKQLSALSLPIIPSQLSRTISDIRLSLSRNVLQHLLPMSSTVQVLRCLKEFFLLNRGDFAVALINEAESRMQSRQQSMGRLLQQDPVKTLQSMSIKDAELNQALQQVWRQLAVEQAEDDDSLLEYAQKHISLATAKVSTSRPSTADSATEAPPDLTTVAFNNLLFPTPVELSFSVSSPLDLFLSPRDISTYSTISTYLLAIRRGHQKLNDLWRKSGARRERPLPRVQEMKSQKRRTQRATAMRKVWATCSAATFLLSETAAFFEGEIIKGSCEHFQDWVEKSAPPHDFDHSTSSVDSTAAEPTGQKDPETLASGHRTFLASLTYALLLTDVPYTKDLRSLLGNVDNLVALFARLLNIQQKTDLEQQSGTENPHTAEEEQKITLELDRARKKVDSDLRSVVNRLRKLDTDRIGSLRYLNVRPGERGDFEVWKSGGVDRLLMKLEFGRMVDGRIDES